MPRSASGVPPSPRPSSARAGRAGSLLHSPYLWATVAGLILIPAMRPLLRFEPAPPPLFAFLPDFRLTDQHGRSLERESLAGWVTVVGFLPAGCQPACAPLVRALDELDARYSAEGVDGVRLLGLDVGPASDVPAALRAHAESLGIDGPRWMLAGGGAEEIDGLLEIFAASRPPLAPLEPAPAPGTRAADGEPPAERRDLVREARLVLLDRFGGIRGDYGIDEAGLDEVFHRSRHVLRERRPPRRARVPLPDGTPGR